MPCLLTAEDPLSSSAFPQEVIVDLLKSNMTKSGAKAFLIDGFPRAMDQDAMFEKMIKPAELVLYFNCPRRFS